MKRIYKKRSSEDLRKKAEQQLRDMRAKIEAEHPDLLSSIRDLVEKAQENAAQDNALEANEVVQIDRKKNLEAILKYAAMNPGSQKLKDELKGFLN